MSTTPTRRKLKRIERRNKRLLRKKRNSEYQMRSSKRLHPQLSPRLMELSLLPSLLPLPQVPPLPQLLPKV
jgi:hypothetical protein